LSFGWRGLCGVALGDPAAAVDPFRLASIPDLSWKGEVPPIPQPARGDGKRGGPEEDHEPSGIEERPSRKAARTELQVKTGRGSWKDVDKSRRAKALAGWEHLLAACPGATELGTQLADAEDQAEAQDTLRFAFQEKATATLEKRLSSLTLYARWARAAGFKGPLPQSEAEVYKYVRELEANQAPPTRAQGFVEALRFLIGVGGGPRSTRRSCSAHAFSVRSLPRPTASGCCGSALP